MDFERLIAALNDYVIEASVIVIAIRNSINCAALIERWLNWTVLMPNWPCYTHKYSGVHHIVHLLLKNLGEV